jgi:type II secretory pathway pseudopilin PulG
MMRNEQKHNSAFTLIEIMIATLLVGITVATLIMTTGSFTRVNAAGIDLSTAEFLIEEIRELTVSLDVIDPETNTETFGVESGETLGTYDDLDDFNAKTFSPPIDINRSQLDDFAVFSQVITVQNVNTSDLALVVANHTSPFVRVTVRILMNNILVTESSWVRAR